MIIPEKGFYYHYKHNPSVAFNDYVYEVVGIALHSEEKTYLVAYRPIYSNTYLAPANFSVRPLDMFMENVVKDDKEMSRFKKITDSELVAKLSLIRNKMYS